MKKAIDLVEKLISLSTDYDNYCYGGKVRNLWILRNPTLNPGVYYPEKNKE